MSPIFEMPSHGTSFVVPIESVGEEEEEEGLSFSSTLEAGTWIESVGVCSCCCGVWAGALNLRYCAIVALHVLHLYSPFSISMTPSPSSSLGFSNTSAGEPSYAFSHLLQ